ncbi:hypothetical protein [Aeromonas caviae]|uniref:hypothetical protein n=1 Tax=Aeromonas caviae TaxID=648 RepID=UPI002B45F537|nr:hypothetical protein [Aeromonas caviae]
MKLSFSLYQVGRWGIYEGRKHQPAKACDVKEMLLQLHRWGVESKRPLMEKKTYSKAMLRLNPSYLLNMVPSKNKNGDWFVILWNEVENRKGKILYANAQASSEKNQVKKVSGGKDAIPGFPTFFWFLPELNTIACVSPSDTHNLGLAQFRAFMLQFISFFSDSVIKNPNNPDVRIGYSSLVKPAKGPDLRLPDNTLIAACSMSPYPKPGYYNEIKSKASKIKAVVKVISAKSITSRDKYREGLYQVASLFFGIDHGENKIDQRIRKSIKLELPVNLTVKDIDDAIEKYESHNYDKLYDVGYKMDGEQKLYHLSGGKIVEELDLNVPNSFSDSVPDAEVMMNILQQDVRDTLKKWISS